MLPYMITSLFNIDKDTKQFSKYNGIVLSSLSLYFDSCHHKSMPVKLLL